MDAAIERDNNDDDDDYGNDYYYYTGGNGVGLEFHSYSDSSQPAYALRPKMLGGISGDVNGSIVESSSFWNAFGTGGYANEPPLLEELGIHLGAIRTKSLDVLRIQHSQSPSNQVDNDDDLAGPLLFLLLFGASLLLRGQLRFGSIYGVGLLGVLSIFWILNLMSPKGIAWSRTASVLGYSLLPMVLLSGVGIVLPLSGTLGLGLTSGAIAWCTAVSSASFTKALCMDEQQRPLVAYPIGLFYTSFALMTVY